jgi:hypothetical protein
MGEESLTTTHITHTHTRTHTHKYTLLTLSSTAAGNVIIFTSALDVGSEVMDNK